MMKIKGIILLKSNLNLLLLKLEIKEVSKTPLNPKAMKNAKGNKRGIAYFQVLEELQKRKLNKSKTNKALKYQN